MADDETQQQRYLLTLAYDGWGFHGWQAQHPPEGAPLRTVQGVVRETLQEVLGQRIKLIGASRTDSGVHALGQVALFDAATRIPVERLGKAINSRLPEDVEVRDVRLAPDRFDVIGGVTDKQYRYRIWNAAHRPLGMRWLVYHCWRALDPPAMDEAARELVGRHDFASFAAAGSARRTTVRTVHECRVEAHPARDPLDGPQVHVVIRGDGFLYNMVRIVAGTLVEVGRGRWGPEAMGELLAARDRHRAGPTLPPHGLCLEWIRYGEHHFGPAPAELTGHRGELS